jgi:hypothetical protein
LWAGVVMKGFKEMEFDFCDLLAKLGKGKTGKKEI